MPAADSAAPSQCSRPIALVPDRGRHDGDGDRRRTEDQRRVRRARAREPAGEAELIQTVPHHPEPQEVPAIA